MGVYFLLPETVKPGVPHSETESTNRLKELLSSLRERDFGLVNLVYFFLVTAFSIMTYAFVLYTAFRFGYNAEQNGYLFAMVGIVSVLGQGALFHPLVNKFGEAPLAAFGCLLMALSFVALPFLGPDYGGLSGSGRRLHFACVRERYGFAGDDQPRVEDIFGGEAGIGSWDPAIRSEPRTRGRPDARRRSAQQRREHDRQPHPLPHILDRGRQ